MIYDNIAKGRLPRIAVGIIVLVLISLVGAVVATFAADSGVGEADYSINYTIIKEKLDNQEIAQEPKKAKVDVAASASFAGVDKETIKKFSPSLIEKIESQTANEEIPIIVMFKRQDKTESSKIRAQDAVVSAVRSFNGEVKHQYKLVDMVSAKMPAGKITELAESPFVEKLWHDEIYVLPPIPDQSESLQMDVSTQAIGANYVWDALGYTGSGITVAVVDSGIDYDHPDLGGGFGPGYRVKGGYDFYNNDANPMDDNGHGTHVAGTIGANGTIKGVALGVSFLAAKVCGAAGCPMSSEIAGIDWTVANGADIISISLGRNIQPTDEFASPINIIADAAVDMGVVVVIAAGNEGPGTGTTGSSGTARKVITVGASNDNGTVDISDDYIADFSNRGPSAFGRLDPDVVAPGVTIYSTVPAGPCENCNLTGYLSLSGTSMATPHVSGAAALMLQSNLSLTPKEIRSRLMHTASSVKVIEYQPIDNYYTGVWNGSTSQGYGVHFNVSNSNINRFVIMFACPNFLVTRTYVSLIPIINNKFNSGSLAGTFTSPNTANGTFSYYSTYPYYCSVSVGWKAKTGTPGLQNREPSIFEQGSGLINLPKALSYDTEATINNNDRWEETVIPGFTASTELTLQNKNSTSPVSYAFALEPLKDLEGDNFLSSSNFALPGSIIVAPNNSETIKISFSAPLDAKPSIYGTVLVITGSNSNVLRIPVVITIPMVENGMIQGTVNDDSMDGFGDWIYYKIKSHNGTSLDVSLEWASRYDDLDLFLFAPNGVIVNSSATWGSNSESVSLQDMVYDEYWLAVQAYELSSYEKKEYNLKVSYGSGLKITPSAWQGEVMKGELKEIDFDITNSANEKSNLNLSIKRLMEGEHNYSTGAVIRGLRTIWKASDSGMDILNTRYMNATLKWDDPSKDLDMYLMYPSPGPAWAVDTTMFSGIDIGYSSAPAFADLDNDGDLDLIIGENVGLLNYYKNTGTASNPVWAVDTTMFSGINVGSFSAPAFADLDNDGDLDLIIGENAGILNYYKNTGTASNPVWAEDATMFYGIDVGSYSTPAFSDLDNDDDLDLIIGENAGILNYYKNTGTASNPVWTVDATMFYGIDVGSYSTPAFSDLDNDGDLDLIIGEYDGILNYYKNTGTASNPVWTKDTTMFSGIDVGYRSAPAFADLDNDGDLDLIIGDNVGLLNYYMNMDWGKTRFNSQHNNTMLGEAWERIENADVQYYIKKYGDVGVGINNNAPSLQSYNLTVDLTDIGSWNAASVSENTVSLGSGETKHVKVWINSSALGVHETYDALFMVQNNTEDFATVPLKFSIKPGAIDATPPASVTNLQNMSFVPTYIKWTWNDPADADFDKVMVYLDGAFRTNVSKGVQYYNATGFAPDTEHTISTKTADANGNVNQTWNNKTARTAQIDGTPVVPFPCNTCLNPIDPDNDGLFEDVNGNGWKDFNDVVLFFNYLEWAASNQPIQHFDFNGNGRIDFNDIIKPFEKV